MPEPSEPELPIAIRKARRLVESVPQASLLSNLRWFDAQNRWGLKCRLAIRKGSDHVPQESDWWVLLEAHYPWGDICFYPALTNSITATFPHQKYNGIAKEEWRSGELCLRTPLFSLGRRSYDIDPLGEPRRLKWHFDRAIEWLNEAVEGTLLSDGDAYELPIFFPGSEPLVTVANFEDQDTFAKWTASDAQYGVVELIPLGSRTDSVLVVSRFSTAKEEVLSYPIGSWLKGAEPVKSNAIWVRLDSIPVLPPHQAPHNWGEFRESSPELFERLERAVGILRDGEQHLALVGFPVPRIVGQAPDRMHWQPLRLPVLSSGQQFASGFRQKSAQGYWQRDLMEGLRTSETVNWQGAKNWSKQQANARGIFSEKLCSQSIALIGAGAIGSHVAVLLIRGGVERAFVIDGEDLEYGNLCRHTLGLNLIDRAKAHTVAMQLSSVRATVESDGLKAKYPEGMGMKEKAKLSACSLVIDCTGSDEVLFEMSRYPWETEKLFCSVATGYYARRIYIYLASGLAFPFDDFQSSVAPWLRQDLEDFGHLELGRESAGCWHISFPARVDQIVIAAATAVRCLDEWANADFTRGGLRVFEQGPNGVVEVSAPANSINE